MNNLSNGHLAENSKSPLRPLVGLSMPSSLIEDEMIRLNQLCTELPRTARLKGDQLALQRDEVKVGSSGITTSPPWILAGVSFASKTL
jgi:hypothetical protein